MPFVITFNTTKLNSKPCKNVITYTGSFIKR